jgi:uncharacterized membrane protein
MMSKQYLGAMLLFVIWACSNQTQPNNAATQAVPSSQLPNAEVKKYIGMVGSTAEGIFFRQCGKDTVSYAVMDSTGEIIKRIKAALPYGYEGQTVMATVEGTLKGKATEGVAARYDNVLTVHKITALAAKDWDGYCFGFEFVVFGTEPFWAVEIAKREGYIDFNDAGNEKYYHFKYNEPLREGDTTTYESVGFDGTGSIKIVIKKEKCNDGMSEKAYPFSATVSLNGKMYKGCAQW